jgi:hypothetical protein
MVMSKASRAESPICTEDKRYKIFATAEKFERKKVSDSLSYEQLLSI